MWRKWRRPGGCCSPTMNTGSHWQAWKSSAVVTSSSKSSLKAVFGVGIIEYLQRERVEKARELLARGEHTVAELAYMTGYEHPRNFSTAFKRRFGVRPGEVSGGI
jgi:methylphosphotriester-DNA--protein-cysteine methyltransferase